MFLRILKGCSWQKFHSSPHVLQYFNIPLGPFSYATTFYPPSALLVYIYCCIYIWHCLCTTTLSSYCIACYMPFQPQHLPYHVYYSFLSSHSLHAVQFVVTSIAWSFNLLPFGMWLSTLCWTPSVLEAFIAKVSEVEVSFVRASQACKPSSVRGSRYLMEGCVPSWPYLVRQWRSSMAFCSFPYLIVLCMMNLSCICQIKGGTERGGQHTYICRRQLCELAVTTMLQKYLWLQVHTRRRNDWWEK